MSSLDDIAWDSETDFSDRPDELGTLLAALGGDDAEARDGAVVQLSGRLARNGNIAKAALTALPFLLAGLESAHPGFALEVLVAVACPPEPGPGNPLLGHDPVAWDSQTRKTLLASANAQRDRLLPLLGNSRVRVRALTARLLAYLPTPGLAEELAAHARQEGEMSARASAMIGAAVAAARIGSAVGDVGGPGKAGSVLEAAWAGAAVQRDGLDAVDSVTLRRALGQSVLPGLPWFGGSVAPFVASAITRSADSAEAIVALLFDGLRARAAAGFAVPPRFTSPTPDLSMLGPALPAGLAAFAASAPAPDEERVVADLQEYEVTCAIGEYLVRVAFARYPVGGRKVAYSELTIRQREIVSFVADHHLEVSLPGRGIPVLEGPGTEV